MRLIDADALKQRVGGYNPVKYTYEYGDVITVEDIDSAPTAQPERKKGTWILKPNIYGVAYCSECGYELHTNNTNFCPYCGADMKGGNDETD